MPMQIPSGEMELEHMFYAATATAATATMTQPLPGSREPRAGYTYCGEGRGPDRLPEKRITQQALDAFFQCAATLFYVMTAEKATQLLERVYHDDNASAQDLCELCALAAIGSSYKVDEIPGEARAVYFYLASTGLNEAIEADAIQGMRIFICLCMSSIMDKSSSARLLIVSALNLARGKMEADLQKGGANERDTEEDEYRRTLQTLVFLEGWLSYSLGYRNCLKKSEIDLVHYTIPLTTSPTTASSSALTTRLIQSHMTKLTLLASGSQDEIAAHGATYWSHADTLSSRLNTWHHNLPPDLHLDALTRDDGKRSVTILQERALYLMHILYIDMRLQLHCQLIKASYVSHRGPEADENFIERLFAQVPSQTLDAHMTFAVQLAGIVSLLFRETATMTRCWLVIRSVFDACIVLLFSACRRYASSPSEQIDSMGDIFTHVDTCLTVLTFCSRRDIVAHRLFEALDSVFRDLSRLTDTEMNNPPGQGGSNLNASGGGTQGSLSTSREMCIQYIVDDACAEQVPRRKALVGVMVRLLDLMSPGGNFWV
ncbi:hypothetical protein BDW74DRAFT_142520 [Aspergillus multicolor]|uniref:fungal specific transcription factor domain-containing protein n=1 Tax=Aspergillus multicolor TaxID=41759 RepID=UPI003CCD89D2